MKMRTMRWASSTRCFLTEPVTWPHSSNSANISPLLFPFAWSPQFLCHYCLFSEILTPPKFLYYIEGTLLFCLLMFWLHMYKKWLSRFPSLFSYSALVCYVPPTDFCDVENLLHLKLWQPNHGTGWAAPEQEWVQDMSEPPKACLLTGKNSTVPSVSWAGVFWYIQLYGWPSFLPPLRQSQSPRSRYSRLCDLYSTMHHTVF